MGLSRRYRLLVLVSIAVFLGGILLYMNTGSAGDRAALGDFIGGVVSSIALLWLVAGFFQQSNQLELQRGELQLQRDALERQVEELSLQRNEIKLQREVFELQKEEMSKMGYFTSLGQIAQILEQFDSSVRANSKLELSGAVEISSALSLGMSHWHVVLGDASRFDKVNAFLKWIAIERTALAFLGAIDTSCKIYSHATGNSLLNTNIAIEDRIVDGFERLKTVPYVQNFAESAYNVAQFLITTRPGRAKIERLGLQATYEQNPKLFFEGKFQEHISKLRSTESTNSDPESLFGPARVKPTPTTPPS